jgi:hypothetical protein
LLSRTPILVIASEASSLKERKKTVDLHLHKFNFACQQFGLRTLSWHIQSSYPTFQDIEKAETFRQRSGSSLIIGVGSGAAIDLAKSVGAECQPDGLILVPGTSAAVLASCTDFSLLLDTREETIATQDTPLAGATVVVDPQSILHHPNNDVVRLACLSILLDTARYSQPHRASEVQPIISELQCDDVDLLDALQQTAHFLSTGQGRHGSLRNAPLALATSLIPPAFSSTHILEFWASLVPSLVSNTEVKMSLTEKAPPLASLALNAPSMSGLIDHVRSNQASCNALDVDTSILEYILASSLNR